MSDLEAVACGALVCTRLDDGRLRVDHADPRIFISPELLEAIIRGAEPAPLQVGLAFVRFMPAPLPEPSHIGSMLKVDGVNQTVVYRIVDYIARVGAYVGEWPD